VRIPDNASRIKYILARKTASAAQIPVFKGRVGKTADWARILACNRMAISDEMVLQLNNRGEKYNG